MCKIQHIGNPLRYCLRRVALRKMLNTVDRQALVHALETLVDEGDLMEYFRGEIETLLMASESRQSG